MADRHARTRIGLGLAVIGVSLLLLPLLLNVLRGGAEGVGVDPARDGSELTVAVTYPASVESGPVDGRLILVVSDDTTAEPRFQVSAGPSGQQIFGVDVESWRPDESVEIGDTTFGFPLESLARIPPGFYRVQAVLNRYETFVLPGGDTVKLPPDRGEGQRWNRKPGNLYSRPVRARLDPRSADVVRVSLSEVIPSFPEREDTEYIRHVRLRSERLSEFWGRPIYLEATLLLPEGWAEHPDARYPLMIYHGHHHRAFYTPVGFRPEPVGSLPEDAELTGYDRTYAEYSHRFYRDWTGPDFPRMILVTIQHATPYYDDSYAVNSANNGPYGDAITHELVPYVEERFRGMGEAWARGLYGGSTGGWEALAAQIFYPDEYNGAWASCPDPVDFRAHGTVNLYEDSNAYRYPRAWGSTSRPARRDTRGHVLATVEQESHMERVLGSRGRSGGQWDAWQAVFSPRGDGGYPAPIWDKRTGEVDPEVAAYWRENYDLRHILERDWGTLGRRLEGKLHVYVGDMDDYYLNNAVVLLEEFLESTTDPHYGGEVAYGDGFGHCWSGDPDHPNRISRLTYNQRFAPRMEARFVRTAPSGADTVSWRY